MTVLAVVLLSASLAYWGLQLFKPQQRAIAAPPAPPAMALNIDAAKGLFGGQIAVAAVSNYQLKGVVAARGEDSAAILSVDNKPAEAVAVGKEVVPGVLVKEVYPRYVLLSEGGVIKRVDLPSDAGISSGPPAMPGQQQQQMPPQQPVQPIQPQPSPPAPPPPSQPPPQSQRSSVAPMTIAPIPSTDRQ
ncbi:type II secretion system protein N [Duganella sp. CT11-25]|uniref:type II secretion system protein N n=1 Tax=Duganella sp. CT11-25 TaxID=3243027 RepID=UPI0039B08906